MALPEIFEQVCRKNGWTLQDGEVVMDVEGGRTQTVYLQTFVHETTQMARAYTLVGSSGALSPLRMEAALKLNYSLPHGAMAFHQGQLVMTDTFVVQDADVGEVEDAQIR